MGCLHKPHDPTKNRYLGSPFHLTNGTDGATVRDEVCEKNVILNINLEERKNQWVMN